MTDSPDRLYQLLPAVYRERDAEQGWPLRALLGVIAQQVQVLDDDISRLYENWFIETCEEWVVPYLGDLVGYRPVFDAGQPGDPATRQGLMLDRILTPRREVANTIRSRRRKGTVAALEEISRDVAGWPARAVEFAHLLSVAQSLHHPRTDRGHTVDLRAGDGLLRSLGAFGALAHSVDVRRVSSRRGRGRYNIPSVGLFVWRLRSYPVTRTPAYCAEQVGPHCFTFSALGNDTPLFLRPAMRAEGAVTGPLDVPTPIRRREFERHPEDYYGRARSLRILVGSPPKAIPPEQIVPANLTGWRYRARPGQVAVDPERGRIAFPPTHPPKRGVWVSYHYGFSADLGGGEYQRRLLESSGPPGPARYTVDPAQGQGAHSGLSEALDQWRTDDPDRAIIEIARSGVYTEQILIELRQDQSLQIRAANGVRAVIRLLDWQTSRPDSLSLSGASGSRCTLDGLLVTGRGVQVEGDLSLVAIRHCTLVPGWGLDLHCEPQRPAEPSIELVETSACVVIDHSIVGSIQVALDEVRAEPIDIRISDSIVDATATERDAVSGPGETYAHAVLQVHRSTVIGRFLVHALDLAEDSIFLGELGVARRQRGCMRFCYVHPGCRSPRRYECQPDLAVLTLKDLPNWKLLPEEERKRLARDAELRVEPDFESLRYGTLTYGRLASRCGPEIARGAHDQSEMGVFHDLYQPQRAVNLQARLEEFVPAGMDAGIIFAT